jgi:hypothetical protein
MKCWVFIAALIFITACSQVKPKPENEIVDSVRRLVEDTIIINEAKSLPDRGSAKINSDTILDCVQLLHSFVNSSTFDPQVKRFNFKVNVDEVTDGIATLKVTMRNTERDEDMAIGWLKLDFNKNQLLDITNDPDHPQELVYDTTLFRNLNKYCRRAKN